MTAPADNVRHALPPVSPELARRPLEYLKAESRRIRAIADLLTSIAQDPGGTKAATGRTLYQVISFELPVQVQLREQHLLPLLQKWAAPEDDFAHLQKQLLAEYTSVREHCETVGQGLAELGERRGVNNGFRGAVAELADNLRRLVSLEMSVLYPLAGVRLPAEALKRLAVICRRYAHDSDSDTGSSSSRENRKL